MMLVTGSGGSGKTRLGREACVQMLMAGWDAGLADEERRDGTPADGLQRPTLLMVDDADLHAGLIAALIGYLRWDDAGPPVRLLLLARAAGAWWDRLVLQQELADLASLALQLAPQPHLAAELADQMPPVHSVQLAALAATLTSQKVTQYRADALGGDPHTLPAAWPGHRSTCRSGSATWGGRRRRWTRPKKPSPSSGSWPRPARRSSAPTWPAR